MLKRVTFLGLIALVAGAVSRPHRLTSPRFESADRGRRADAPHEMTALGWRDIFVRAYIRARDERLVAVAASVAYYTLLGFVPAISVAVSLWGLFSNPDAIAEFPRALSSFLPSQTVALAQDQARRLAAASSHSLSVNLLASFCLSLWAASAAVRATFDALNVIYGEQEKRSFLKLVAISLASTVCAVAALLVTMTLIGASPAFLELGPLSAQAARIYGFARWPLFYVIAVASVVALYWIGPSRAKARIVWLLPGAMIAALVWSVASAAFAWYVEALANYTAAYGSLAAVIVFMTWLWLSASVILFGAQINAELEHQTARDTTFGGDKPIGMRGAAMADSIGQSP